MATLKIKWLDTARHKRMPALATAGSACLDVYAEVPVMIEPGKWAAVETGFAMQIPSGHEVQIRPRSGLALKHGVTVLNSPGTIDADYRGEVKIILINHGAENFVIQAGDRIAQMALARVEGVDPVESLVLDETDRSSGGFGSTGR